MKYLIVQGDGMADHPQQKLSGKTPLEAAKTPNMDTIASAGSLGRVNTIPTDLPPGSAVGNMSLMGLNPERYYTGRAPLEARGLGVDVEENDIAFRCNLVKLSKSGNRKTMKDYSGGNPTRREAESYVKLLDENIGGNEFRFYQGISYRNLLLWKGGRRKVDYEDIHLTPPHDITGKPIEESLPRGAGSDLLRNIQEQAEKVLCKHGNSGNGIWLWGQGISPEVPTLKERYGLGGTVISAVDLVKGLGIYSGLISVEVEGANGNIDTNYEGKVNAAKDSLTDGSLVFLHIEAPDEASHKRNLELKLEAIERIDQRVLGPLIKHLESNNQGTLLLVTDHITGLESGTHERGSVPFAIFKTSTRNENINDSFSERHSNETGINFPRGYELIDFFLSEG
ncbi:MAG: cofactor-independent phosphoglycerate mutase [Candidatus Bipolaricaulota bacterium]